MKKIFQILALILLSVFLYSESLASDAPGYQNPGSRVPPRTPAPKAKPKPAPKKAPRKEIPKPVPVPIVVITALDEGKVFFEQRLYTTSKQYFLRAVKEEPRNAYARYYLGLCYEKMGDFENAQKNFTAALQLDRQLPMLSRVVVYPDDPHGKNPIWDPVRPARITQINSLGVPELNEVALASRNANPAPPQKTERELPVYVPPDSQNVEAEILDTPAYTPPVKPSEEVKK